MDGGQVSGWIADKGAATHSTAAVSWQSTFTRVNKSAVLVQYVSIFIMLSRKCRALTVTSYIAYFDFTHKSGVFLIVIPKATVRSQNQLHIDNNMVKSCSHIKSISINNPVIW